MLIGYARVSKADGSQLLDLQRDALLGTGIAEERIYEDRALGTQGSPSRSGCLSQGAAARQYLRRLEARPPGTRSETSGDDRG